MGSLSLFYVVAVLSFRVWCIPTAGNERHQAVVPSFVNTYGERSCLCFTSISANSDVSAPVVYLQSTEVYFPSDIGAQVANTQPEINYQVVTGAPNPLTLDNLDSLNALNGSNIYLTSKESTTSAPQPQWLKGSAPDSNGKTDGAVSCSIIVCDYGNGTVDAYYMYFYA